MRARSRLANPSRPLRWREAVVGFVVIVFHLLSQFHAKAEAHSVCVEHPGEICHVEIVPNDRVVEHLDCHDEAPHDRSSSHHASEIAVHSDPAEPESDSPAPEPEHDHCPLQPLSSAHGGVVLPAPIVVILPLVVVPSAYIEIGSTLVPARAPLTYAPKTSPPASQR